MYDNWWRVEATGLHNVPGHDRAMSKLLNECRSHSGSPFTARTISGSAGSATIPVRGSLPPPDSGSDGPGWSANDGYLPARCGPCRG